MIVIQVLVGGGIVRQYTVPEGTLSVGSGPENGIRLQSEEVSRRHAQIVNEAGSLRVRDLDSTNGTLLNGHPVSESALGPGDELLVGRTLLRLIDLDLPSWRPAAGAAESLYSECLSAFCEALGYESGYLLGHDGRGFHVISQEGRIDRAVLSETLLERAAREPVSLAIDNPLRHPSLQGASSLREIEGPWSILYVPLRSAGHLTGMICMTRRTGPEGPAPDSGGTVPAVTRIAGALLALDGSSRELQAESLALLGERLRSRAAPGSPGGDPEIIGSSDALAAALEQIRLFAPSSRPMLLVGETGTGKDLLARKAHGLSPRAGASYVAVNCAAIPESLAESELFGHEKGAFSGAVTARRGLFQRADRGTLFLDEIDRMPLPCQSKLLRVLDHGEVTPVGSDAPVGCDVRILAAAKSDLNDAVEDGRFLEDLYYRLAALVIHVPPLRERAGDIPALARSFIESESRRNGEPAPPISVEALKALRSHQWKGNIRDLQNVITRAYYLAQGRAIERRHLPPEISGCPPGSPSWEGAGLADLSWKEGQRLFRQALLRAHLQETRSAGELAERLGLSWKQILRHLRDGGLEELLRKEP